MKDFPRRMFALLGVFVLFALLLLPISLGKSKLAGVLEDASHGVMFGFVALGILFYFKKKDPPPFRQYMVSLVTAITIGGVGEVAQFFFTSNRHAQFKDLLMDACGAVAGLCFYARMDAQLLPRPYARRLLLALAVTMCLAIILPVAWTSAFYIKRQLQEPELVTWRSTMGWYFLSAGGATASLALVPSQWADHSEEYALYVTPSDTTRWAGVTLAEVLPDWTSYRYLDIELVNPNDAPLELNIRIDDHDHNQEFNDRFNRSLLVTSHWRETVRISLVDIQHAPATRTIQLKKISRIVLFEDTQRSSYVFYLCGIRLVK